MILTTYMSDMQSEHTQNDAHVRALGQLIQY